jgi:hypothetical protein
LDRRAVNGPRAEQVAFVDTEVGVHPEGVLGASPLTKLGSAARRPHKRSA